MTNLTEQWKKGELPSGMYYIEFKDGDIAKDVYAFGSWGNINEHFLKQVLAEVPSYEQWQKHRKTLLKTQEMNCDLEIKNTKLKAVLKRCREFVDDFPTDNDECWAYRNAVLNGIDELLGEE